MAAESEVRDIIRSTWMSNPGVCALLAPTGSECRLHAGFILGTGKGEPQDDAHNDILTLDMHENMNDGKSYQYFYEATRKFPWATHFVKLDTDTYPFLHMVLPRISSGVDAAKAEGCDNVYLGETWTTDRVSGIKTESLFPPPACGYAIEGDMLRYEVEGGFAWNPKDNKKTYFKCWQFMRGGLYVISRQIALQATESGGAWSKGNDNGYYEDGVLGYNLVNYAREHDMCLSTWDPPSILPFSYDLDMKHHWKADQEKGWLHLRTPAAWQGIEEDLRSEGLLSLLETGE
eukprot:TRINITY_DN19540_c0_g1_i2.p1 TRINITY_DN19540_c0_g1~~TRINITY_DN19540_c0_g1_i2.p1  ORF type:complete len:289 (-),score=39.66 TRINITY_DN19540_c0_g1_i2:248-1114(-)